MTACLSDDLQQIDAARKTAVIVAELHRLDIDIAALQESRLADNGSLTEKQYTFFWQGKNWKTDVNLESVLLSGTLYCQ